LSTQAQPLNIVHGTWIPDETDEFAQRGAFYLWVETDTPAPMTRSPAKNGGDAPTTHPRQLVRAELEAFLRERLGMRHVLPDAMARAITDAYFSLPSANGAPLPSVELARYVDEETPDEFALAPWRVCCYRLDRPIPALHDIYVRALHDAEEFQLGADLLFWHHYTRELKAIIARDHYIPALAYRELAPAKGKRKKAKVQAELYPAWEFVSAPYEAAIERYAACLPPVCAAGAATPDAVGTLYDAETLLRHAADILLYDAVTTVPTTAKLEQQIAGSLLDNCLFPQGHTYGYGYAYSYVSRPPGPSLEGYKEWAAWREGLIGAHTAAAFALCFRLREAPPDDVDDWRVEFLMASKRDPSLKLSLADYWSLDNAAHEGVMEQFGADIERTLLLALGSAARIYPKVWEGLETPQPVSFRLTLEEAFAFLHEHAWVLEDAGYTVIVPSWYTPQGRRRAKIKLKTSARSGNGTPAKNGGYFSLDELVDYQYQLSIDGQPVAEEEWRQLVEAKTSLVQFRGQWMELDRDAMRGMLEYWQSRGEGRTEMSLMELLRVASGDEDEVELDHDNILRDMLSRLRDKSAFAPVDDPPNLHGVLRDYQKRGVAWLQYLESLGLNPLLADDMGLGKSVEVIAHLVHEKNEMADAGPTLLIAPTSVLGNWRKEFERFAPHLRTLTHHGPARIKDAREFAAARASCDVVITSFALARLDEKLLRGQEWRRVVVDEAQNIKNPQSAQAKAIAKLPAHRRVALTGTPVENRLLDLWSIFNFLNPGYLGKEAQFRKSFEAPIQKDNDPGTAATLKRLVEPFILRRVKTDKSIIDDLPDKIEQKVYCPLTHEQASLYEAVVKDVAEKLESAEGMERRGLILSTLMKLKQVCNHPAQFLQDGSDFSGERSHKLSRLGEMIEEALESGESLLVFTQFTEIGEALERYIRHTLRRDTYYLHGGTSAKRREEMVAEFQDPETEPSVFILSLRAGGVGITLTKANHVFHFDRWWNPAVEDQASDRAFRIGQRKNVFVHKFVTLGTMEERIDAMIEDKKRLSSSIVGTDEAWLTELDNDTFKDLIALRRDAILG